MLDVTVRTEGLSEAVKSVMALPGLFARARASALSSLGYNVQQELKREGIRAINGGYLHWQPLNPHTGILARTRGRFGHRRAVDFAKTRYASSTARWFSGSVRAGSRIGTGGEKGLVISRKSTRREPFSRMVNMVRYHVDDEDENFVEIGFLNTSTRLHWILRRHATGYPIRVTDRMRRFFFALGFPLRAGTSQLAAPARPWVNPVERAWRPKATPFFERKFWDAYRRYAHRGIAAA